MFRYKHFRFYSSINNDKILIKLLLGSKILKGNIEKDLVNGYCSFEKIQIKEVTSHFRKGYVFLVVYPKMPTFGNLCSGAIQQNFVDFTTIKPLIIEKVVVKAKKINLFRTIDSLSQNLNENPNEIQNENPNENQYVSPNENLNDINISDVKDEIESEIKEKEIIYE